MTCRVEGRYLSQVWRSIRYKYTQLGERMSFDHDKICKSSFLEGVLFVYINKLVWTFFYNIFSCSKRIRRLYIENLSSKWVPMFCTFKVAGALRRNFWIWNIWTKNSIFFCERYFWKRNQFLLYLIMYFSLHFLALVWSGEAATKRQYEGIAGGRRMAHQSHLCIS